MQLFLMIGDEVLYDDVLDAQSPKQKPTNKKNEAFSTKESHTEKLLNFLPFFVHCRTEFLRLKSAKIFFTLQQQIFFSSAGDLVGSNRQTRTLHFL